LAVLCLAHEGLCAAAKDTFTCHTNKMRNNVQSDTCCMILLLLPLVDLKLLLP